MVECAYCKKIVNELEVKYWLDEKFYVQGSKVNYPFCSCDCGTKFYNENKNCGAGHSEVRRVQ